jgi:hypothetical protein
MDCFQKREDFMVRQILIGSLLAMLGLLAGCSRDNSAGPRAAESDAAGKKYLLAEEPAGAKSVTELRKSAKDGDDVVIVGRIGGEQKPWIEGKAGFLIVDCSLKACSDIDGDGCETPWDYCCESKEKITNGLATIKFLDEHGKTIDADARKFLGVDVLNTVVVRGKAKRDDEGNLIVLASGLYRRPDGKK